MRSSPYGNAPSASLPPLSSSDGIGPSPAPGMSGAQIANGFTPCFTAWSRKATAHSSHMRWSTGKPCTSTTGVVSVSLPPSVYVVVQFNRHIFSNPPLSACSPSLLAFASRARLVLLAGPCERLPHDGAVAVGHLPDEGVGMSPDGSTHSTCRASRPAACNRRRSAPRSTARSHVGVDRNSRIGRVWEEFGHGERLQADRQLRQGDIAQIFCDVARHRFTQRFVIERTSSDRLRSIPAWSVARSTEPISPPCRRSSVRTGTTTTYESVFRGACG